MLKLKSNTIEAFPFELYARLNDSQLEDLAKTHYLTSLNSWMLPQLAHYFGTWRLVYKDNLVDCAATARANIVTDHDVGIWRVATKLKRGSLVKSQVNPEFASYSALVPLVLMGAKKFQGVKYSNWNVDQSCALIDSNLLQAMLWQPDESHLEMDLLPNELSYGLSTTRLLELRETGLTIKSGLRMGTRQAPTSAWCLRGMQNTELAKAPKLVGTMLTQIWVANPSLRTEYMILEPNDWDLMPPPLVSGSIFNHETGVDLGSNTTGPIDLPWLVEAV